MSITYIVYVENLVWSCMQQNRRKENSKINTHKKKKRRFTWFGYSLHLPVKTTREISFWTKQNECEQWWHKTQETLNINTQNFILHRWSRTPYRFKNTGHIRFSSGSSLHLRLNSRHIPNIYNYPNLKFQQQQNCNLEILFIKTRFQNLNKLENYRYLETVGNSSGSGGSGAMVQYKESLQPAAFDW